MKKLGFIGMGNMARAIADGILAAGAIAPSSISAYAPHYDKLTAYTTPLGITPCTSALDCVSSSDVIIMAVKPYVLESVLPPLRAALAGKAILSVVAGYDFARYTPLLDPTTRVQYIMPNTPCMVGSGVLLFEEAHSLTPDEHIWATDLFSALGEVVPLPTHLMPAGMAISGCGPAFVAMMIEALADAGVKYGLPRATAYRLASATALGTGRLQLETNQHPGVIKDAVCSPAGTTIRGVEALETHGMRRAFMEAVKATIEK